MKGHWSNLLEGGPGCVNICVAPRGQAAPHSHYDTVPETRELERLQISGAGLHEILNFVDQNAPCDSSLETAPAAQ